MMHKQGKFFLMAGLLSLALAGAAPAQDAPKWWKGNLHTHSLWSDGSHFPEDVASQYKELGYHFLALTDHDVLSSDAALPPMEALLDELTEEGHLPDILRRGRFPFSADGKSWLNHSERQRLRSYGGDPQIVSDYLTRLGPDWAETRTEDGDTWVRLQPLETFRHLVEEPGRFLLLEGMEITGITPVHVLGFNLAEPVLPFVPAPGEGATAREILAHNLAAVREQGDRLHRPVMAAVLHPNYHWAVTAEDIAHLEDARFFEVFNGHRSVNNYGDELRPGTERIWDIVLTKRLAELGHGLVYGIATDDTHEYTDPPRRISSPGRGWVQVHAPHLTPRHLLEAMDQGHFYASTGVTLEEVRHDATSLSVRVAPEEGVRYSIQFIGTRRGYDPERRPRTGESGAPLTTPRRYTRNVPANMQDDPDQPTAATLEYSADIGEILREVEGPEATYTFQGDELYVRAKVLSDKPAANPWREGDLEVAWVQPVLVAERPKY